MWIALTVAALATDLHDARYLIESYRAAEATPWIEARMSEAPDDPTLVSLWLVALSQDGSRPHSLLPGLVDRWAQAHPSLRAQIARAQARLVATRTASLVTTSIMPLREPGPWCDDTLGVLEDLPEGDLAAQIEALALRREVSAACKRDVTADEAALAALRSRPDAPSSERLRTGDPGLTNEDLPLVEDILTNDPWSIPVVTALFHDDHPDPAEEAARAALLAWATPAAEGDRAWQVSLAMNVLGSLGDMGRRHQVSLRLQELDPENLRNNWNLSFSPHERAEPTHIIDPAARLKALRHAPRPEGDWERSELHNGRIDALTALGRSRAALAALDRWWRISPNYDANFTFAETAMEQGRRLRAAEAALDDTVEAALDPYLWPGEPGFSAARDGWAAYAAQALELRARLHAQRGAPRSAADDLQLALAIGGASPARQTQLGLVYDSLRWRDQARLTLAVGLAGEISDGDLRARGTEALRVLMADVWSPDGAEGYIAAAAQALAAEQPKAAEPPPPAPDLTLVVDGVERPLSSFEGPVILDLWATWCGPCRQSLPHLDTLARRWGDAVTVLAVSVDDDPEDASRYTSGQGTPAFQWAWAGYGAMEAFGVHGIPAYFVLDAEHRVVGKVRGAGPGGRTLEEAVKAGLGI